ncbi:MAG: MlaE family lipid ABC transporter permease subunit [Rhizobiaceae bacterium]
MLTDSAVNATRTIAASVHVTENPGGTLAIALDGIWTTRTVALVDGQMRALEARSEATRVELDVSGIEKMDTAGAWLVQRLATALRGGGAQVTYLGQSGNVATLLGAVADAAAQKPPPPSGDRLNPLLRLLDTLGRLAVNFYGEFLLGMHILGATIQGAQMKAGRKHALRPAAIVHQMDRMGVGALPVVLLMSTIIGAIIAQQGAFQLRYFGAEIFVVDLVAILVLREIGVLLTAIMIAGRSGSAVTAEIGSMKMREEVDALTVIGLNPIGVLVFPRLVALVIMLPCLTIAANAAALAGAIAVAWVYSDIAPAAFIERMRIGIDLTTIFAGMIKAPFMAIIIGIVASIEGLKTGGSAESLGSHVTASVVKSIFIVILVDGLFAMFYAAIDF